MNVQVTLNLPESVVQHAQVEAIATQRTVEEVLAETLGKIYPAFPIHPQRAQMEQEVAAFEAMHTDLWAQYPYEYVAVYGGQIIDHDKDQLALLKRVKEQLPTSIVMIDQVLPTIPPPLRIRSPRLVKDE